MSYPKIREQIDYFAKCEDALFSQDDYWAKVDPLNRFYKTKNFWKVPKEEELKNCWEEICGFFSRALRENRKYKVKLHRKALLFFKKIPVLDEEEIKKYLPERVFYCTDILYKKIIFLLGRVSKIKTKNDLVIGEEDVANLPLNYPAGYSPSRDIVFGREYSSTFLIWDLINKLRARFTKGVHAIVDPYKESLNYYGLENFAKLSRNEILGVELKNLDTKIRRAARIRLEHSFMAHEKGHRNVIKEGFFPHETFSKCIAISRERSDVTTEALIRAHDDSLADTIKGGRLSSLILAKEPERSGLISLFCSYKFRFPPFHGLENETATFCTYIYGKEVIPAFYDYLSEEDEYGLKKCRDRIFNEGVELSREIVLLDERKKLRFQELVKIKNRIREAFKVCEPELKKTLKEIRKKIDKKINHRRSDGKAS